MQDNIIRTTIENFRRLEKLYNFLPQIVELHGEPGCPINEVSYRMIDLDKISPYVEISLGIEAAFRRYEEKQKETNV
jgi:hypothetical protein